MQQIAEHLDAVKASQEISSKRSKRSAINGHHTTALSDDGFEPDMDIDDPTIDIKNESSHEFDRMDTEGGTPNSDLESSDSKAQELLKDAVLYGKDLKQHFKADQSQLVTETMTKIFGMLAYPNPTDSDQAYLLDRSQRGPVAEAVNSAILGWFFPFPHIQFLKGQSCRTDSPQGRRDVNANILVRQSLLANPHLQPSNDFTNRRRSSSTSSPKTAATVPLSMSILSYRA